MSSRGDLDEDEGVTEGWRKAYVWVRLELHRLKARMKDGRKVSRCRELGREGSGAFREGNRGVERK